MYLRFKPSQVLEDYYENGWIERNEDDKKKVKKINDAKEEEENASKTLTEIAEHSVSQHAGAVV